MNPPPIRVAVVPITDGIHPDTGLLGEAADWYARVSLGRWRPQSIIFPPVELPQAAAWYLGDRCGLGAPPRNSQRLAAGVLATLKEHSRARLAEGECALVLAAPAGFAPHTWHLENGGWALGQNHWVRRYTVLPQDAPLGSIVHELGHLLLDWPDLVWDSSVEQECLMARGACRGGGRDPAQPCAPLLVRVGWRQPVVLTRELRVNELQEHEVGYFVGWEHRFWVARHKKKPGPDRLFIYAAADQDRCFHPRLVSSLPLGLEDESRALLGIIAPKFRWIVRKSQLPR